MIRVHLEKRVEVEVTRADPQPWMSQAACLSVDPEIFFDAVNSRDAPGKAVCKPCPVKESCLIYALLVENPLDVRYGIFGDTSPAERDQLYKVLKGRG